DAVFLRLAALRESKTGDDLFRQRAARPFGEQSVFAPKLHAPREGVLWLAVATDAHVAGGDADDLALVAEQEFGSCEARINLDAERFRLDREITADIGERADEIAVIVH